MRQIANNLTNYLIRMQLIQDTDAEIYQYGLLRGLELILNIIVSILVSLILDMFWEGLFFFVFFVPLRSYAGGLHLKHYISCFFLSLITFTAALFVAKYYNIVSVSLVILFFILIVAILLLYPVENRNREVNEKENIYFYKKMKLFIAIDIVIMVICLYCGFNNIIMIGDEALLITMLTMFVGKIIEKNN